MKYNFQVPLLAVTLAAPLLKKSKGQVSILASVAGKFLRTHANGKLKVKSQLVVLLLVHRYMQQVKEL